nr:hypothetical protein [Tanacetum cinerariifolium]
RVESSDDEGLGEEDASKKERIIGELDADEDITLVNDQEMFDADKDLQGIDVPTDSQHTPTIIQPSTSQPLRKQKPRKTKKKDTQVPQLSVPTESVADEAVNEEMNDRLVRAATTASSLEA